MQVVVPEVLVMYQSSWPNSTHGLFLRIIMESGGRTDENNFHDDVLCPVRCPVSANKKGVPVDW